MSEISTISNDELLHTILKLDSEECNFLTGDNLEEEIQFKYPPSNACLPGSNETNTYEIDLNTRTIAAPQFLSVEKDHQSTVIYFKVDRYFDYMDLANTVCVVEYLNPGNEDNIPYIYIVPFFDTIAEENKIIFPWVIGNPATQQDGVLQYAIRFFKVSSDRSNPVLIYDLHTLPASSMILDGLNVDNNKMRTEYEKVAQYYEDLIQQLLENKTYWHILE